MEVLGLTILYSSMELVVGAATGALADYNFPKVKSTDAITTWQDAALNTIEAAAQVVITAVVGAGLIAAVVTVDHSPDPSGCMAFLLGLQYSQPNLMLKIQAIIAFITSKATAAYVAEMKSPDTAAQTPLARIRPGTAAATLAQANQFA
jgi:hypothetical protein